MPTQDVKLNDITQVNKGIGKTDRLKTQSDRFYGNENERSYSNSSNNDVNNPFIIGIKLWQANSITWINTCNEFMKLGLIILKLAQKTNEITDFSKPLRPS